MLVRILTAVVALPIFFLVIFVLPPVCLTVCIIALSIIGVFELLWVTGFVREPFVLSFILLAAGCIPAVVLISEHQYAVLFCVMFVLMIALFVYALANSDKFNFEKLSSVYFAAVIIPLLMSSIDRVNGLDGDLGRFFVLIPFIAAWVSDAFAYFFGTFFGKHKLMPKISAKKTVEGSVAGIIGTVVCMLIYGLILQNALDLKVNYIVLAVIGFAGSIIGQTGDLSMSFIKREFRVKDYGSLMPGHGGILDRFDSVLFTAPLCLMIFLFFPVFIR